MLVIVAVALATPTFGCFAYYRLQAMENVSIFRTVSVTLALPLSTLALIAINILWPRRRRHPLLWRLCLCLLFGSMAFLIGVIY